jgi:hypothetical protein
MRRFIYLLLTCSACCLAVPSFAAEKDAVSLFNGEDLTGWDYFLVEPSVKMADVWSVKDGLLVCKGQPMGYLATKKTYKNFKLVVEWRWPEGKKPGNSGVLLRISGKPMKLPKCVEAQLQSGSAGDIWAFQGFKVEGDENRFTEVSHPELGDFVGVKKMMANEKKPGEWNKYEITLNGGKLALTVNGKMVNECSGCDEVAGHIGLQSEGGEIHFRTVKLLPLDD